MMKRHDKRNIENPKTNNDEIGRMERKRYRDMRHAGKLPANIHEMPQDAVMQLFEERYNS